MAGRSRKQAAAARDSLDIRRDAPREGEIKMCGEGIHRTEV